MNPSTISQAVAATVEPIPLRAGERRLFLDDGTIASMQRVRRTFHPATKDPGNPLLRPEHPWEEAGIVLYGSVVRLADGAWRMWYMASRETAGASARRRHCLAYAESDDGLHWRKPLLDAVPFEGRPSNIVMDSHLHPHFCETNGVLFDPADPDPERRYKSVFNAVPPGSSGQPFEPLRRYLAVVSADGLHWRNPTPIRTRPPVNADVGHLAYDPVERRYLLWARSKAAPEAVHRRAPKDWFGRTVSLLASGDFERWEDLGVVMAPDLDDPPESDIYSMAGFRCGDTWVGLVQHFDQTPGRQVLQIQLACSRDATHWTRAASRQPILPVGGPGEWDRFNQSTATAPVAVGDEIRLYYSGRTWRHPLASETGPDTGPRWSAIGLARWRLDGFASLDASFDGGEILTRPLRLDSPRLGLNVKSDFGAVEVELLSLEGATLAASRPLTSDSVRATLDWVQPPGQAVLRQPVRLRFRLRNAQLYSFECVE